VGGIGSVQRGIGIGAMVDATLCWAELAGAADEAQLDDAALKREAAMGRGNRRRRLLQDVPSQHGRLPLRGRQLHLGAPNELLGIL
jgi:hypothetical protein